MFCKNCGNQINDNSRFCNKCGVPISKSNNNGNTPETIVPTEEGDSFKTPKIPKVILAIIAFVVIFVIGIIIFPFTNKKHSEPATIASSEEKTPIGNETNETIQIDGLSLENETNETIQIDGLSLGNIVTFGNYEQDGNLDNGKEPIEWDVIAVNDDCCWLISHYVLDATRYSTNIEEKDYAKDGAWETSNIRSFLNDYFYNEAFSNSEKMLIIPTTYMDITDNVFLLTENELPLYFEVEKWQGSAPAVGTVPYFGSSIICGVTPYIAQINDEAENINNELFINKLGIIDLNDPRGLDPYCIENARPEYKSCAANWMLAPEGYHTNEDFDFASYVMSNGYTCSYAASIYSILGVRPVIAVTKDSVTISSSQSSSTVESNSTNSITNGQSYAAMVNAFTSDNHKETSDYHKEFCTLQINLTRENTLSDKAINAISSIADSLFGTNLASGAQYDVAVFMDGEIVDVIPYNEAMREYTFLVKKDTLHQLELYNANVRDGLLGAVENYQISENQVFARQINTYSDGKIYLETINPNSNYDYEEDIEFIKTVAAVTVGSYTVLKIANETGIIDDLKLSFQKDQADVQEWLNELNDSYDEQLEMDRKLEAEMEAEKAQLEQKKIKDAKANLDYLKKNDPYEENIATQKAADAYYSLLQ